MNRILLTTLLLLTCIGASAAKVKYPGKKAYIYRYYLTDKAASTFSLEKPARFLSRKSVERRQRQGLAVDSTDLPVPRAYVRQFMVKDAEVLGTSRWQNTVLVRSADSTLLQRLAQLPIVRDHRCVFVAPDSIDKAEPAPQNVHDTFNRWDSVKNDPYGMARQQIEMLGGIRLHEAGLTGRGITIAILDGGFQHYDRIPAFRQTVILGVRDFVDPTVPEPAVAKVSPAFHLIDHGTKVLSAMAARAPEVTIGTAPDASYWLLRSEDHDTEQPVEEDYWTMAAEFADSVGADIINSSLGYYAYDAPLPGYRLRDLDGQTAFVSRSASMLASKGIVLCNSAGNSGMGQWKKIGVPADARDILTVGAIDAEGRLAPFSSVGPSQDGRVKPDVVARGSNTTLISGRGTLVHDMGTSFSTPVTCGLVACLWQGLREKTALDIIDLVRQSADQHDAPNNIYGYGIPNFWEAYQSAHQAH
ncbi:MAG: S8 family serine peptidase [Prevotella sp.]|nr:S8 family serine peptidase [Prevotella sp.]